MKSKKRSALPSLAGAFIGVRLNPADLRALDRWIRRDGEHQTRPEAVRQLFRNGLAVAEITRGFARHRSPHAVELAGSRIDLLLNLRNC
jgi:hypothetical protein